MLHCTGLRCAGARVLPCAVGRSNLAAWRALVVLHCGDGFLNRQTCLLVTKAFQTCHSTLAGPDQADGAAGGAADRAAGGGAAHRPGVQGVQAGGG